MPKIYKSVNVYDAGIDRIEYCFDNFEKVYLSFSGGKDSTVMLHMTADVARKKGKKFGLLIVDLEGQYDLTIKHLKTCVDMYKDLIDLHWVCLPIHLRNAVSNFEPFWKCWDADRKDDWIRDLPDEGINDNSFYPFFVDGMEFEDFVPAFGEWYSQGKSTACLVGIRADESLNRFRTIASNSKVKYNGMQWTTKVTDNVFNAYPIYDWKTEDIWIYHAKNSDKPSNGLYDRMYKAGLTIHQMRICQPYGDDQRRGLRLFHIIEPETRCKVVARVNGANGGALYISETGNINGYRKISKPGGHTWESFAKMLLNSMPHKTKQHYENKIYRFVSWWIERGYSEGIPDEGDVNLEAKKKIPSWRRVAKSLLRNDFRCKGLSFSQHKSTAYDNYLKMMEKKKETGEMDLTVLIGK